MKKYIKNKKNKILDLNAYNYINNLFLIKNSYISAFLSIKILFILKGNHLFLKDKTMFFMIKNNIFFINKNNFFLNLKINDCNHHLRVEMAILCLEKNLFYDALYWLNQAKKNIDRLIYVLNLSVIFHKMNFFKESIAVIANELALKHDFSPVIVARALNQKGLSFVEIGGFYEAEQAFSQAILYDSHHLFARGNLALRYLARGEWSLGWQAYLGRVAAHRWHTPMVARLLESQSKTLVLLPEQGLGDELFFMRFVRCLAQKGWLFRYYATPKVYGLLQAALQSMVSRIEVCVMDEEAIDDLRDDFVGSVADMPYLLYALGYDGLPPPSLRLPMHQALICRAIPAALKDLPRPWLGVTWRAGVSDAVQVEHGYLGVQKKLPFDAFVRVFSGFTGTIVVLQRMPYVSELAVWADGCAGDWFDASALNEDLSEMAHFLACLDEYVTVSNTNLHVCAMLETKMQVLVPFPPEFRWLNEGEVSPWFPEACVYRQSVTRDWSAALQALQNNLHRRYPSAFTKMPLGDAII